MSFALWWGRRAADMVAGGETGGGERMRVPGNGPWVRYGGDGVPARYRPLCRLGDCRSRTFRAYDDVLRRPVAVVLGEAPLPRGLLPYHPNLVTIYDAGPTRSGHFLVSQFVDGPLLSDRGVGSALHVRSVLEVGVQIGEALAHLHGLGLAHGRVRGSAVRFGGAGVPHLLGVRFRSADDGDHGSVAETDVASLLRMLRSCVRFCRRRGEKHAYAARSLSALGAADRMAAPELVALLGDVLEESDGTRPPRPRVPLAAEVDLFGATPEATA